MGTTNKMDTTNWLKINEKRLGKERAANRLCIMLKSFKQNRRLYIQKV